MIDLMKVRDVMQMDVKTIPHEATYEQAAKFLNEHQLSGALVVDPSGKLVGVLSEKDLFRVLYPFYSSYYESPELYQDLESREMKMDEIRNHPVKKFMSTKLVTIDPEAPILRAGAIMLAQHVHRLPVLENGNLVGIIYREHIYRAILNQHFSF